MLLVIPLGFEPKTHSLEDYPSKQMLSADIQVITLLIFFVLYSFYCEREMFNKGHPHLFQAYMALFSFWVLHIFLRLFGYHP